VRSEECLYRRCVTLVPERVRLETGGHNSSTSTPASAQPSLQDTVRILNRQSDVIQQLQTAANEARANMGRQSAEQSRLTLVSVGASQREIATQTGETRHEKAATRTTSETKKTPKKSEKNIEQATVLKMIGKLSRMTNVE
jgi:hypothetical protein